MLRDRYCKNCNDKNFLIECKCGCSAVISLRDRKGRIRGFEYGHACGWGKRWSIHSDGYIYRYMPEHPTAGKYGYILEHRLIMEQIMGRNLTIDEHVHHKNGNRKDNRPENLELLTINTHSVKTALMRERDSKGRWTSL